MVESAGQLRTWVRVRAHPPPQASPLTAHTPLRSPIHDSVKSQEGKAQICFDFTKGVCSRGDKCKYSHDLATIVHFNSKEKGICFDYLRNQCHRGLLCRFSHDLSNIAQQCQVGCCLRCPRSIPGVEQQRRVTSWFEPIGVPLWSLVAEMAGT